MEENKKKTYHYVTAQSSELGKRLVRLIHRYDEVMQAASKLVQEVHADEWSADPRYVAGGIWRFIFKNPPKAKKALMVVAQDEGGNYECAPNPEYNRGLRLAKKIAALPHVVYGHRAGRVFRYSYRGPALRIVAKEYAGKWQTERSLP